MIYNDHFQILKIQFTYRHNLLLTDDTIYNLGNNAYASNPAWYKDGDNKMVKVIWREEDFLIQIKILNPLNLSLL